MPHIDSPKSDLRVLVVEDDGPSLELICEYLASQGVGSIPVMDSSIAGAMIHVEKFDGVLLDLMMPGLDGFELTRQIRKSFLNWGVPVIVVSGREDKKTMQEAFEAGATFFLHKPLDKKKLSRLLATTLGSMLQQQQRPA
jgi:DNA-binding response OmpR family regulator